MKKVLALTEDGKLTPCTALPEMRGRGRCNHIAHQEDNESPQVFMNRANRILSERNNDAIKIPDVKPMFDFKHNSPEGEHNVNVEIKPYRMSEEEKEKGVQVTRKADFLRNFDQDTTLYIETEEGKELWNEMDISSFEKIHPKITKPQIMNVLLMNDEIITESNLKDKFPTGMVYDDNVQARIDKMNERVIEKEKYQFTRENPDSSEEDVENHIKNANLDLIELKHGTGVEKLNKVAKEYGFTATKDIPVLPYYMRPSTDNMDDQLTTSYLYMYHVRKNPNNMQRAYLNLLNNKALPIAERKYSDGFASKSLADQFAGKGGVFRKYLSGRAVPYTGRAIIEPSLDIDYGETILPAAGAIDIFKPSVAKYFTDHNKSDEELDNFIAKFRPGKLNVKDVEELEDILQHEDVRVLLNRQPSSHTANFQSFKVKLTTSPVIFVHPLVDEGFMGDHDGDAMSMLGINSATLAPVIDRSMSARLDINTRKDRKLDESQILPTKDSLYGIMSILKARQN